jgi:hypothetical protein
MAPSDYPFWSHKPMSKRVHHAKLELRPEKMLKSPSRPPKYLKIEDKLAKFGPDASLHFDSEAWAALITEQRRLIATAAGVDPAKVKIYVGH